MCRYSWQNDGWKAVEIHPVFLMGKSRRFTDDGVGEFEIMAKPLVLYNLNANPSYPHQRILVDRNK
jgi:hypothetical protein